MKNFILTALILLAVAIGKAQIPQFINYQAVSRYNTGSPIPNQPISLQFKIRQGSVNGTVIFEESQNRTTDDCGLFNAKIGSVNKPAFARIDWSIGNKFLEVTINNKVSGTTELASVPYAQYANNTLKADTASYAVLAQSSLDWVNVNNKKIYSIGKNVGIGTTNPDAPLDLVGNMRIKGDNVNTTELQLVSASAMDEPFISSLDENGKRIWDLNFADRSAENRFALFSEKIQSYVFNISTDGNVGIKTNGSPDYALSVKGDMDVRGSGSVRCLEIKGGCDWYEEANAKEIIQPGHVVTIDTDAPINSVKLSSNAYDPLVTGVVSGAGGINPGIGLQQKNVLEGNTKVAMGGKVKVYVTGEVKPGDLLTSSNKPGYAMTVKNRKKAFGAVLGKALSIPDSERLVLMLVMMQ